MPDELAGAYRLIREGQLDALHKLTILNRKFISPSFTPNAPDVNAFLNEFDIIMSELQDLTGLIASYREHSILISGDAIDRLIKMRAARLGIIRQRVEKKLERFHKAQPLTAPGLHFDAEGRPHPDETEK